MVRSQVIGKKYYGFEYRTPGSWLLSPSTTLVTLTLAKLAIIGTTEDDLDFAEINQGSIHVHFSNLFSIPLLPSPKIAERD